MTTRTIGRLPIPERRRLLDPYVGWRVRLTFSDRYEAGSESVVEGLLVSVAQPRIGTASELIIVREAGYRDQAYSTADLDRIESAP